MHFKIDGKFVEHFRNLEQVFLYITDECNLSCAYCLYKPDLTFHLKDKEIELRTALALLSAFKKLGASKLTIMGGEPTLYGHSQGHEPLLTLICEAKKMGWEYVRVDTNGVFESSLLEKEDFRKLDEITFSLDGHTHEINDLLRGKGVFAKCLSNINKAVNLGYNVDITACVHRGNMGAEGDGKLLLDSLIHFVASLLVRRINFHPIFKMGVPRDTWIGENDISPEEWKNVHQHLLKNIDSKSYSIPVRIPERFVSQEEFERNPDYYGYCPAKMGERVLVFPNGMIRICALMIGTPYGVARFYDDKIIWDRSTTNELRNHKLNQPTPCTNMRRNFGDLFLPLCISFKAKQEEFVWKEKLNWENRRRT